MTYQEYRNELFAKFESFGFIESPLIDDEIGNLHQMGVDTEAAFEIANDIYSGTEATEAFAAVLS